MMIRLGAQRQEARQKVVVRMVAVQDGVHSGRWCAQWKTECAVEDGVCSGRWYAQWKMVWAVEDGVRSGRWCAQ